MITLIVGSTGAGKTTYAKSQAKKLCAGIYSIDDWMRHLYWQDMPEQPDMQWFVDNQEWYTARISRSENLIKKLALERAAVQQRSLLDLGFSTRNHRKNFIDYFKSNGFEVETHFLNVDTALRWSRVQERNKKKGETFVMTVDRAMFEYMEDLFEAPTRDEGASLKVVTL
ncbi:MAG: ATP-binding protein [Bdellovibrionales bacterium]